ncbi:MAG TPA: methyltransferase domain-containing protein [Thiohalobacter sp.]|nr:methyltransferase domain-containing protein [Thiohalobacter sp.]
MAVIWRSRRAGVDYEVRSAGRTRRLYTNGVLHTQYNPRQALTGSVWDLLLLPALLQPGRVFDRVLVLGVGGGAVINLLRRHLRVDAVVGVELDGLHLRLARRFFDLKGAGIDLIQADACDWLADYPGEAFDLIIDDLFTEIDGEPARAITATPAWLRLLDSHLTRRGMLVMNFPAARDLRQCGFVAAPRLRARYRSAFELTHPRLENRIGAWMRFPADSRDLRRTLKTLPELDPARSRLEYRIRRLA